METLKELEETKNLKKVFLENTETGEFGVYLPEHKMFSQNNGNSPSLRHLQVVCKVDSENILEVLRGWNYNWSIVEYSDKFKDILVTL